MDAGVFMLYGKGSSSIVKTHSSYYNTHKHLTRERESVVHSQKHKVHGLGNPEDQWHIYKGAPIISILNPINPVLRIHTHFFKIY